MQNNITYRKNNSQPKNNVDIGGANLVMPSDGSEDDIVETNKQMRSVMLADRPLRKLQKMFEKLKTFSLKCKSTK